MRDREVIRREGDTGRADSIGRRRFFGAVCTLGSLNVLLLAPTWIREGRIGPQWFALEALLATAVFLLLPHRAPVRRIASGTVAVVLLLSGLGLADVLLRRSLDRPLNLYLDLRLAPSVVHLAEGTFGGVPAVAGGILAAGMLAGAAVLLARMLASLASRQPGWGGTGGRWPGIALLGLGCIAIPGRWVDPRGVVLGLPSALLVREQADQLGRMLGERERFAREMAVSPAHPASGPGLLGGLGGRDVILAFVESYGISALRDPRYAPVLLPRLEAMERQMEEAGIGVRTGLLDAPSQGGMSWLGHGSLLSGLWLDNQLRYDLLLAEGRPTLVDDFRAAGYRTVALMPAITRAWPEGRRLGYDEIHDHATIPYAGPPLNWVTMPDQFTWSHLQRGIRSAGDGRPLFAELGLISSHAPWTPILEVLDDWDAIGDGRVFDRWAGAGEPPEELWRDPERVREHYARSLGYAVDVLASWVDRHLDERTVVIALGDHQPAPLITGEGAARSVPVHVFARDPALLERFEAWGFARGTRPPDGGVIRRMDAFRPWFVQAFSEEGA